MNTTVLWLTWRQLFARRRIWLALAFSLAPLVLALFYKVVGDDTDAGRLNFLTTLNREIVIGTLLPLAAAVFGTTAFGGEVDDGTLIYLLVKPVARWQIVVSKYVVAVLSTFAVMIPATFLPWLLLRDSASGPGFVVGFLAGAAAGAAVYNALFLLLGLWSRRALVVALIYVIAFEAVISRTLAGVKSLSVREFAVAIAQAASSGTVKFTDTILPMSTVWTMGGIFLGASIIVTMRRLTRYEVAERL
jgi:ABC-2 type transport system permease protein